MTDSQKQTVEALINAYENGGQEIVMISDGKSKCSVTANEPSEDIILLSITGLVTLVENIADIEIDSKELHKLIVETINNYASKVMGEDK